MSWPPEARQAAGHQARKVRTAAELGRYAMLLEILIERLRANYNPMTTAWPPVRPEAPPNLELRTGMSAPV